MRRTAAVVDALARLEGREKGVDSVLLLLGRCGIVGAAVAKVVLAPPEDKEEEEQKGLSCGFSWEQSGGGDIVLRRLES